jgi:hypothetical protein
MRSLLTLVGAAVVTFAVVGYFLGWYKVRTTPGPDGHREVTIDVNGPKIKEDLKKSEARLLNAAQGTGTPGVPSMPPLPTPGTYASPNPAPPPPGPIQLPMPPSVAVTPPAGTVVIQPVPAGTSAPNGSGLSLPYPPQ